MTDDKLDIKTYSLAEVAEMVLPPDMTNVASVEPWRAIGVSSRSQLADDMR